MGTEVEMERRGMSLRRPLGLPIPLPCSVHASHHSLTFRFLTPSPISRPIVSLHLSVAGAGRLHHYGQTPSEAAAEIPNVDNSLDATMQLAPAVCHGAIEFQHVSLRYRDERSWSFATLASMCARVALASSVAVERARAL